VAGAIDWTVAERVAGRASGKDPFADSYHYASLAPDFDRLTSVAEDVRKAGFGYLIRKPARTAAFEELISALRAK